jgi:hypothetical protein
MSEFIEVPLPDGRKVRFPKGMTRAQMAEALNSLPGAAPQQPNTNPGVSPEAPPDMFLNPQTGQYTSRELLTNHMMQNETAPTTATGATIMGAGRGATLGGIDEISGYLNSVVPGQGTMAERNTFGREYARAAEEAGRQSNPDDMLTSEIAGALSVPLAAPFQAMGLLPRILGSAGAGGLMGAAYGFLTGEGEKERLSQLQSGGAIGAGVGALAPVVGAGVQKLADKRAANKAIAQAVKAARPTAEARAASGQAYDAFEGAGVEISPQALSRLRSSVEGRLTREGLDTLPGAGSLTPGGQRIVDALTAMDDQVGKAAAAGQNPAVPLTSIEQFRRQAGNVAQGMNPMGRATPDARLGTIAIDEIDNFIKTLDPADVPIGDVNAARDALLKARSEWARASKTQLLDNVIDAQDDYLGGPASAIRNKVATLLRNPKTRRQFSEAEQQILRKIIGGNMLTRAVRLAGNGIGRQLSTIAGTTMGGVPGALAGMATGEISSEIANRHAIKAAEIARAVVSAGSLNNLPVASDSAKRVIEALMRRAGTTVPQ